MTAFHSLHIHLAREGQTQLGPGLSEVTDKSTKVQFEDCRKNVSFSKNMLFFPSSSGTSVIIQPQSSLTLPQKYNLFQMKLITLPSPFALYDP